MSELKLLLLCWTSIRARFESFPTTTGRCRRCKVPQPTTTTYATIATRATNNAHAPPVADAHDANATADATSEGDRAQRYVTPAKTQQQTDDVSHTRTTTHRAANNKDDHTPQARPRPPQQTHHEDYHRPHQATAPRQNYKPEYSTTPWQTTAD